MLNRKALRACRKGGHYRENGLQRIDTNANREGSAIRFLNLCRPHVPHIGKGILWNTNTHKTDVRNMLEEQTQGKRLRRSFQKFFQKFSCTS